MLAFDLLRVALARAVHLRLQLPRVGAPMICIILCDPKRLQQPFQLQKHLILATPKDIGKDGPREVINRVPQPPLLLFLADKRPHLIHLGFASTFDTYGDLVALPSAQQGRVRFIYPQARGTRPPARRFPSCARNGAAPSCRSRQWAGAWRSPGAPRTTRPSGRSADSPRPWPRKWPRLASRCVRSNPAACGRTGARGRPKTPRTCSRTMNRPSARSPRP